MTTWLAFDIGTTGTKAALLDDTLRVTRQSGWGYPTDRYEGGRVEQNAADWGEAAMKTARRLKADDADAIVITGQMQNLILLNKGGAQTRSVILYSDTRAHVEAEEINAALGAERLTALTGNEQGAGGLLAKLRWLRRYQPEALASADVMLVGAGQFLAYQLSGSAAADTTTASTTGLLDLEQRAWLPNDLLKSAIGEDVSPLLPPLVTGGAQVGSLSEKWAGFLGVRAGIPVYLAPGDAGAATLGAGAGEIGQTYGYVGTSGWVAYISEQRGDPATGVFTLAHPNPARTICVAPLLTAGGNFDFARRVFNADSHEGMIDAALAQPPSALLYLPYLNGERSPFSDPFARGAFIGLSAGHTQHDLTRAVLEGVAFAYKHALDALIHEPMTRLMLTGGGTQSLGWCQLLTDITVLEVAIADDAEHVGLRGAVLAAQVARGERADYALPQSPARILIPQDNPALRQHYAAQYAHYRAAYPALKDLFAAMR